MRKVERCIDDRTRIVAALGKLGEPRGDVEARQRIGERESAADTDWTCETSESNNSCSMLSACSPAWEIFVASSASSSLPKRTADATVWRWRNRFCAISLSAFAAVTSMK